MRISDWSSDGALPIFDRSRMSLMIDSRWLALRRMSSEYSRYCGFPSGPKRPCSMISEKPMMAFSGVRSSWLMLARKADLARSEEHTSELQSLMRTSYDDYCLKKKKQTKQTEK